MSVILASQDVADGKLGRDCRWKVRSGSDTAPDRSEGEEEWSDRV